MKRKGAHNKVSKTTFEEEQREKDEAFLKLTPAERLRVHEQLRKRIWGDLYDKMVLEGMKVTKHPMPNDSSL